jgi:regulator of sigma E protease
MIALLVLAILVFLIVAHEFGHFIFAKMFGVRVDEFGIGYPPRAFLLGKIGDTEYTLNWIPFGGFVRLFGEENTHGTGSLVDAARWKQALILFAGVAANALVAYLLFTVAFTQGVPRIVDAPLPGEHAHLLISDVVPGSPAESGGILAGDEILKMRSDKGDNPETLTPDGVTNFVRVRGGQSISITYLRAGTTTSVSVHPANAIVPGEAERAALGIGLVSVSNEPLPVLESLHAAAITTVNAFWYVLNSLWTIVSGALQGKPNLSEVVGPVGLVSVVSNATHSGVGYVLELAAFISINLAIVNLIPIPALDGGRLAVLGIEAITRRKSSHFIIQFINTIGIALIILLMGVVTYHDIARLLV